ncbi:F-box/kelch-repeat protein At3g17530-like [Punica granatum]|uniref:F-box/kelch-repeat protein At3g17530-like n=1 Tax=Punica granatum TaxID=22663 RepID=A0A6P8BV64_PUNGR|nr:F-box/kelch-repeat protein At3g17530-like [Punica granatum]
MEETTSVVMEDDPETPSLPMELWTEILLRIPAKHLLKVEVVCRSWHDLIRRSRSFAQSHNEHWRSRLRGSVFEWGNEICYSSCSRLYRFKYLERAEKRTNKFPVKGGRLIEDTGSKEICVLSSCDGLLLLRTGGEGQPCRQLLIYNPITGSYKNLPVNDPDYFSCDRWAINRFGGTLSTVNYQVFGIVYDARENMRWMCYCCYQFKLHKCDNNGDEGKLELKELDMPRPPGWF